MANREKSDRHVNQLDPNPPQSAALDERLQAHIGSQLKSMYDVYLNEPIPDRLVELLEQLDQVSVANKPSKGRGPHE